MFVQIGFMDIVQVALVWAIIGAVAGASSTLYIVKRKSAKQK